MFDAIKPVLVFGVWMYEYKGKKYHTDGLAQQAVLDERKQLQKRSPNNVIPRI